MVEETVKNVKIDVLNRVKFDPEAKTDLWLMDLTQTQQNGRKKQKNKLLNLPTNEAINVFHF